MPELPNPNDVDTLISIQNVCINRADKVLLDNVSLDIHRNEILTLIGPNGAGKTTLINTLLGLIKPDSGTVEHSVPIRFGYMPQKISLDPTLPLSALRFLQLAEPDQNLCLAIMQKTGIKHLQKSSIHSLSGGEMQRLLLARAILRKPNILVLDEPVQGVDITGQASLYQLITQLRHELNCAIVMVSHDLHLVMSTTDRVICLNQHVCCHGSPESVSVDPVFTQLFGKQTVMYNHHHNHSHDIHGNIIEPEGTCQHD